MKIYGKTLKHHTLDGLHGVGKAACFVIVCTAIAASGVFAARALLDEHNTLVAEAARTGEAKFDAALARANAAALQPRFATRADEDTYTLAITMWGEGRSEGARGMRAIGHVVLNRREAGQSISDVVYASKQFSVFNEGEMRTPGIDDGEFLAALEISRQLLAGQSVDPTAGARFYHTSDCASSGCRSMRDYGVRPASIGRHVFYRAMRSRSPERVMTASLSGDAR